MSFSSKIIVITGNMGTGKTTFGRSLAQELGWSFFEEPVLNNPLLVKFFSEPKKYCYDLQHFFIEKRVEILKQVQEQNLNCILDRSVLDSRNAYIPVHLDLQHINSNQYFELIAKIDYERKSLPKADLMIFLNPGIERTIEHILKRDRDFERDMDLGYLYALQDKYNEFYSDYSESPKLLLENFYDVKKHVHKIKMLLELE